MATEDLTRKARAIREWALENRLMAMGAPNRKVELDEIRLTAQAFGDDLPNTWQKNGLTGVGVSDTQNTIIVYTAARMPKNEMHKLPEKLDREVNLQYRKAAPFTLKDDTPSVVFGKSPGVFQSERYTCGSSISVANRRSAGTMGCLVRNKQGDLLGLTNNHVTGGCNNTRIGMPVLAPGIKDISSNSMRPFSLGSHFQAIPMVLGEPDAVDHWRNTDAAVFKIENENWASSSQQGYYDTPAKTREAVADPVEGLAVKKVGRTTGLTHGRIESRIVGPFPLSYDIPTYHNAIETVFFRGRVYFEPVFLIRGSGSVFSDRGDSGALVVTDSQPGKEKAVGLIFAGDASDNLSYMLPIEPILDKLDLKLVNRFGLPE